MPGRWTVWRAPWKSHSKRRVLPTSRCPSSWTSCGAPEVGAALSQPLSPSAGGRGRTPDRRGQRRQSCLTPMTTCFRQAARGLGVSAGPPCWPGSCGFLRPVVASDSQALLAVASCLVAESAPGGQTRAPSVQPWPPRPVPSAVGRGAGSGGQGHHVEQRRQEGGRVALPGKLRWVTGGQWVLVGETEGLLHRPHQPAPGSGRPEQHPLSGQHGVAAFPG